MADLDLAVTSLAKGALDRADRVGRAEAERFVENDPAVGQFASRAGGAAAKPRRQSSLREAGRTDFEIKIAWLFCVRNPWCRLGDSNT